MWVWAAAVVLGLALTRPVSEASPLGAVVTLEPLGKGEKQKVMAHTSVLAPEPCPSLLDVVCEGNNCTNHVTSIPIRGHYPAPGWCLRQWQSIIPFNHTYRQIFGAQTEVLLSSWADLSVRPDTQKVNQPPIAALLPPLRVSVNCFKKFYLSVRDQDGDIVRCRYGNAELGECQICSRHKFLQLDEINCVLVYSGHGETGQYTVELKVEDFLSNDINGESKAMSSTPLQLSFTVEGASTACQELPAFTSRTPAGRTEFTVLPYEEVDFTVEANSLSESISEIAIVGPPGLLMTALRRGNGSGSLASINTAWLRNPNELPPRLPVCFTANTKSLQSEIRCVWIKQKPIDPLPLGTVLQCADKEINFFFPISSVPDVPLSDLQLNDPSCPVSHNQTHVMGRFSPTGCGTKAVHSGSELVYTNTLRTMERGSLISRLPTLALHLSCRFPAVRVHGPHYKMAILVEKETFGIPLFWMEFYPPGEGPFANEIQPDSDSEPEHLSDVLDLHVFSNTSLDRAELMVSTCVESETPDFKETHPLVQEGCTRDNAELQVISEIDNVRIYRINLANLVTKNNTMYVECVVHLCVAILPSQKCPDVCSDSKTRSLVETVFTRDYIVRSGPVFLGNGRPTSTPSTTTTTPSIMLLSHAPEDSFLVVGVAAGVIQMLLQTLLQ